MRVISSEMLAALLASPVSPSYLFEGTFASSNLYLWDGTGPLVWDGKTYLGNGWFRGPSSISENNGISAHGIDIHLNGVSPDLVSLILSDSDHGCRGLLRFACLDDSGEVIDDPLIMFEGNLSAPRINDSDDTAEIILSYEDDLIFLNRSVETRYNHESQQSLFPGDQGFSYVAGLSNWTGFWGNKEKPKPQKTSSKKKSSRTKKQDKRR